MPPIEPSSDIREAVVQIRGLFNAYVEVGFSEDQAMDLVKEHLRSVLGTH
jgi:hypothetical protein